MKTSLRGYRRAVATTWPAHQGKASTNKPTVAGVIGDLAKEQLEPEKTNGVRQRSVYKRDSCDHGSFPRVWPDSSACGTERVALPTVMRRFVIAITPHLATAVDRPVPPNGLGECERCKYTKEAPGWQVAAADENGVHTAEFVTPTCARYRSTAPPLPAAPMIEVSEVEVRIGVAIVELLAA
jgi:hypothetical protein